MKLKNMKKDNSEERRNIAGKRIKKMRKIYGWSQTVLAAKLQLEGLILDNRTICIIESGKRIVTDYELFVIAKVLNVMVDWLLDDELFE